MQKKKKTQEKLRSSSDNICKAIAESYPEQLIEWLFGIKTRKTRVLKTEIIREPLRADSVILLESDDAIFHVEFQTIIKSEPPMRRPQSPPRPR